MRRSALGSTLARRASEGEADDCRPLRALRAGASDQSPAMGHSVGHWRRVVSCLIMSLLLVSRCATAQDAPQVIDAAGLAFFESKIRPVFVQRCYQCHSASSGKSEGSLFLDSRQGVREGGDRGPAIVPGQPQESILLAAISHSDPDLKMPPKGERLPDAVIRDVEKWVRMGAPDPRDEVTAAPAAAVDIEAGRQFWAFKKPVRPAIPSTRRQSGDQDTANWAACDIDHFVLAQLQSAGLAPSSDAEPATLLRRVYFDLVGLPPSRLDVQRFLQRTGADGLTEALEAEVDTLFATKQFGQRWGRHWLDVARYAESSGKEANISFPYAWRYRDYVIDCINEDLPFDRFLVEQIAGDLLTYESESERARLLIATGFLALGPKNLDEANPLQFWADVVDEQIDTVSRAVMANSVACARCHDHKFDPFSMEDYYALAGVFASTKAYFGTFVAPSNRVGGDPLPLPLGAGQPIFHKAIPKRRVQRLKDELAALEKEQAEGMAAVQRALAAGEDPGEVFALRDALRIFWRSGAIEGQLEKVDESGRPLPLAMGVLDRAQIIDAPLLERGDIGRPGRTVSRGFPRVIQLADTPEVPDSQSGRLEFARWLTHPDHPLTARVMANRIWHHLFGAGIVRTVDNFGRTGERPTHPELLDYLAIQLVDGGWSLKQLVRRIVLSRTYRQASTFNRQAFQVDPDNRLLWRASKRRLEAEAIRDAMLAVSGELDARRPAGSLVARVIGDRPISLIGLDRRIPADLDGSLHRSVFLPVLRDRLPDVLDLFDFAEPSLVTGARETTNVPLQALYLMNSPFVRARAESLARRLLCEADDDGQRVRDAFLLCFGREPDAVELQASSDFLQEGISVAGDSAQPQKPIRNHTGGTPVAPDTEEVQQQVLVSFCQALLATAEFRNLD